MHQVKEELKLGSLFIVVLVSSFSLIGMEEREDGSRNTQKKSPSVSRNLKEDQAEDALIEPTEARSSAQEANLCPEEREYITQRKKGLRRSLLSFISRRRAVLKRSLQNETDGDNKNNQTDALTALRRLEIVLEHSSDDMLPSIALCFSGGGFRATYLTLGFLDGAEESNLLDCCTHMAGLSGSTWAIAALIARANPDRINSVREFLSKLHSQGPNSSTQKAWDIITESFTNTEAGLRILNLIVESGIQLCQGVMAKSRVLLGSPHPGRNRNRREQDIAREIEDSLRQPEDAKRLFFEMYGRLIIRSLLFDIGDDRSMKEAHEALLQNILNIPLPLYTALATLENGRNAWLEVTPFEIGSIYHNRYISLQRGSERDFRGNEVYWYHWLATFGNVLGVSYNEFLETVLGRLGRLSGIQGTICRILERVLGQQFQKWLTGDERQLVSFDIHDFTQPGSLSPLRLKDSGIAFNIPWPLLSRGRFPDVLIIGDWSACSQAGDEYRKARTQTRRSTTQVAEPEGQLPFIDFSQATMPVRNSHLPSEGQPHVVHISWLDIASKRDRTGDYGTFKSAYTGNEIKELTEYARQIIDDPLFIKHLANAICLRIHKKSNNGKDNRNQQNTPPFPNLVQELDNLLHPVTTESTSDHPAVGTRDNDSISYTPPEEINMSDLIILIVIHRKNTIITEAQYKQFIVNHNIRANRIKVLSLEWPDHKEFDEDQAFSLISCFLQTKHIELKEGTDLKIFTTF